MNLTDEERALLFSAAVDLSNSCSGSDYSSDPDRLEALLRKSFNEAKDLWIRVKKEHPEIPDMARGHIIASVIRLAIGLNKGFGNNGHSFGPQSWFSHSLDVVLRAQVER